MNKMEIEQEMMLRPQVQVDFAKSTLTYFEQCSKYFICQA